MKTEQIFFHGPVTSLKNGDVFMHSDYKKYEVLDVRKGKTITVTVKNLHNGLKRVFDFGSKVEL